MAQHRSGFLNFSTVYPLYLSKVERKGHTKAEVDGIIRWLTGYSQNELEEQANGSTSFEAFFGNAPKLNPSRELIRGVICGVRIEDIAEPAMKEIRYLDKLIDELANGRSMDKILRKNPLV